MPKMWIIAAVVIFTFLVGTTFVVLNEQMVSAPGNADMAQQWPRVERASVSNQAQEAGAEQDLELSASATSAQTPTILESNQRDDTHLGRNNQVPSKSDASIISMHQSGLPETHAVHSLRANSSTAERINAVNGADIHQTDQGNANKAVEIVHSSSAKLPNNSNRATEYNQMTDVDSVHESASKQPKRVAKSNQQDHNSISRLDAIITQVVESPNPLPIGETEKHGADNGVASAVLKASANSKARGQYKNRGGFAADRGQSALSAANNNISRRELKLKMEKVAEFYRNRVEAYSEGDEEEEYNEDSETLKPGSTADPSYYLHTRRRDPLVVIVHNKNGEKITLSDVRDIYLEKVEHWQNGHKIEPYNLPVNSGQREIFLRKVLNMSARAKQILDKSESQSGSKIVNYVEANPGAIGYVPSSALNQNAEVRVVLTLN